MSSSIKQSRSDLLCAVVKPCTDAQCFLDKFACQVRLPVCMYWFFLDMFHLVVWTAKNCQFFFWQGKAVHVHHFAITWQGKLVEKLAWPGFGEGSLSRKTWYSFLYTVANKACQRKLVDQNLPVCTGFQVRSLLIVLLYSHVITSATVICSRQL